MRIVRIEHTAVLRRGRPCGPYAEITMEEAEHYDPETGGWESCSYDCIHTWIASISSSHPNRPVPRQDGLPHDACNSEDQLFCFTSVEQYAQWFPKDQRQKFNEYGFVAAIYEADDVTMFHGNRQSVFRWETAKRIAECNPNHTKKIRRMLDEN